jgi:hypothetical protein
MNDLNEQRAKEILGNAIWNDGGLRSLEWYLSWGPTDEWATLDGIFSAEELEAIAWWMRNHYVNEKPE